jgi:hypothetical protein
MNLTLPQLLQAVNIPYSVHPDQPWITITLFVSVLPSVAEGPEGPMLEADSLVCTPEPEPLTLALSPDGAVQAMGWQELSLPVPPPLASATLETITERLEKLKRVLCPEGGQLPDVATISAFYGMPVQD